MYDFLWQNIATISNSKLQLFLPSSCRDMRSLKQSQSIIVSGESGAGKTESTKHILKYLTSVGGGGSASNNTNNDTSGGQGVIEQRIVQSNPLLEAFGNSKTVRNNNSSRFGKFIEIHYDSNYRVVGGHISHYLLEKSRICVQSGEERNYHVFYRLCFGAPEELRRKLRLGEPKDYHYLNRGCLTRFGGGGGGSNGGGGKTTKGGDLDDAADFAVTDAAMTHCGVGEEEKLRIYAIVAAVLHLGNVRFESNEEDNRGGCSVVDEEGKKEEEQPLNVAASLMGVAPEELREALTSRVMQTAKGGYKG